MSGSVGRDAERGTWYFVLDARTSAGKRKQVKRRGFARKRDAQDALDEMRRQMSTGRGLEPTSATVADLAARWLDHLEHENLKPTTRQGYRYAAQALVTHLGDVKLLDLRGEHLDGLYATLAHRSASRRRQIHVTAHKMLGQAMRWRLVAYNAADDATAPAQSQPKPEAWTPAEVGRFLEVARSDRWAALWLVFATTGMRRGEAVGLRWCDIDLDAGAVTIARSVTVAQGATHVGTPKSGRARTVSLDPATVAALRSWKAQQAAELLRLGEYRPEEDWVWTWPDGERVHPDVVTRTFRRLVQRAEVPRLRLHALRHAWATNALALGVDVKDVATRLGHSSTRITHDIYVAPSSQRDAEAARAVADLYSTGGP